MNKEKIIEVWKRLDESPFCQNLERDREKQIAMELSAQVVDLIEKKNLSFKDVKLFVKDALISHFNKNQNYLSLLFR